MKMIRTVPSARFAKLGLVVAFAAVYTVADAAPLLTAGPDGFWTGTVKCNGRSQAAGLSTWTSGPWNVQMVIEGAEGYVLNRWGEGANPGAPDNDPVYYYLGAYFPDQPGALKGLLGFGALAGEFGPPTPFGVALETGQATLEAKLDKTRTFVQSVKLDGKSYVLGDGPLNAVSANCEWKLNKDSDLVP